MRKSLHEIRMIEDYLFCRMNPEQQHLFQLKLLLNPQLQEEVERQMEAYSQIRLFGREKLRHELRAVEKELFSSPDKEGFRLKILSFFR